ncbi:MAG: class I SAM-dependent methyltransferase [Gammaproteobacteria bacterium]|nr:class I SAM-dependent methyltransferase [Gammaproteobacteria bacterium]
MMAVAAEARHSRLERMLARLAVQKACLEFACSELSASRGVILELGLGKGRTYDHLRKLFPAREIYVFDQTLHAPRDCVPDSRHLRLGDLRETLADPILVALDVILVHADIGSEDLASDARLTLELAPLIDKLVSGGALVLSDREMKVARWQALPLPGAADDWRYFMYRVGESPASR